VVGEGIGEGGGVKHRTGHFKTQREFHGKGPFGPLGRGFESNHPGNRGKGRGREGGKKANFLKINFLCKMMPKPENGRDH